MKEAVVYIEIFLWSYAVSLPYTLDTQFLLWPNSHPFKDINSGNRFN